MLITWHFILLWKGIRFLNRIIFKIRFRKFWTNHKCKYIIFKYIITLIFEICYKKTQICSLQMPKNLFQLWDIQHEIFKWNVVPISLCYLDTSCNCDKLSKRILVRGRFVTLACISIVYILNYNSGLKHFNRRSWRVCYCSHWYHDNVDLTTKRSKLEIQIV